MSSTMSSGRSLGLCHRGSSFRPVIQIEPGHSADAPLRQAGIALRDGVIADLARQGSLPQPFYMSFAEDDNPASGFVDGVPDPRFSTGYFALRNRFGMLVETHSWKDYPTRVRITRNTVVSVLEHVARQGAQWRAAVLEADARAARLAGSEVPLKYQATDAVRTIDFRGYAYTRTPSEISGALMTRYDDSRPEVWKVPLRDQMTPSIVERAPLGGYLVPAAHAAMVGAKLAQHGIAYRVLKTAQDNIDVETFRADKASPAPVSLESHQRLNAQGIWRKEARALGAGALFVPIAQPKARLVMALLEPQAPDSLLAWGMFNNAFEAKEYMEDYVAEDVAREMLAADPALAEQFRARLASEPAFAKDPKARLGFFYRRHASWDERLNLYPIMRTAAVPATP